MKQTLKRRICAAILCHILLLGLAGCGKANKAKPNDGGDPPVKASVDALKQGQPAADSEETVDGAESLARVRGDLEYDGRLTGAAAYPQDLVAKMKATGAKVDALDCLALAEQAGSAKAVNIVLMGRLSHYFDLPEEAWQKSLEAMVPPKFLELNKKAFQLGKNA